MSSIKSSENNNLVPAQPKTTDEGTPANNKKMEVHDATEKTTDLSPKNVGTEHKEEVLTGNLAQKAAQAMKLVQEKQALVGTTLGTIGGALTGDKGKRMKSTARGFAKGLGTDVGAVSGGLLGAGVGGITGGIATLPIGGLGAIPGALLGGIGGGVAGGRMGHGVASSLLGPYKSDDEKFEEQLSRFLAAQQKMKAMDSVKSDPKAQTPEAEEDTGEETEAKKAADEDPQQRARAKARADDLLNMDSGGGMLADLITPGHWGGTRAGRATQIAQALGKQPSFRVRHPLTSGWMSALGGAGGGALGGAALGGLGGVLRSLANGDRFGGGQFSENTAAGAGLGASIGGLAGYAGGIAHNYVNKRKDMAGIRDALENELAQNGGANINPQRPDFGLASSFLLPASGSHRAGQADAYNALKNNQRYAPDGGRSVAYGAEFLPYGGFASFPRGIVQNLNARARTNDETPEQKTIRMQARDSDMYGLGAQQKAAADPMAAINAQRVAQAKAEAAKLRAASGTPGVMGNGANGAHQWSGRVMPGGASTGTYTPPAGTAQPAAPAAAMPKPAMPVPKPMVPGMKSASGGFDMNALMAGLKNVAKPAGYGALGGAALGGLAGLMSPGQDEHGNTRSRFGAAMRGALGGGVAGGLGGAAMGHFAPDMTQQAMSGISQAGNYLQQQGANWHKKLQQAQLPSSVTAWGQG